MKNKFNPELLKEELKKFKLLSEWDFYMENEPDDRELIYGNKVLGEEDDTEQDVDDIADDLGVDSPNEAPDDEMEGGEGANDMGGEQQPPEEPIETPPPAPAPPPMPEPASDEVELDVTDLVQDSKRTKQMSFMANQHTKMLLQKFDELESRVSQMDQLSKQINDLEKEIIKRNPTPVEKLEMQSLNSYPYTQKLTDYWGKQEGPYDVTAKKEYVLDKDAIDSDYSDANVQKSFSVNLNGEDNEYEEEDY